MANKLWALACIGHESHGSLLPRPHYPSMPKYPKGVSGEESSAELGPEAKALFSVIGMTCSACAGSVEKAIKRLPGIREAVVDVLNNKAHVLFYPSFVNVENIRETIEDVGFGATLIEDEVNDRSTQVCRMRINGMTCTSCSSTVESALQAIHGVQKARVALATEEAEVHYDPKVVSSNKLLETIKDTGFEGILISSGEDISKIELKVDGVRTCRSMRIVEESLQALPGVQDTIIFPELNKISLSYKPDMTGPRTFINVIDSTGSRRFKGSIYPEGGGRETHRGEEIKQYYRSFLWSLIFTIPVFLTSMVFMYIPGIKHGFDTKVVNMMSVGMLLRWVLSTPVQFIIGRRFYIGSYKALRHGSANMDVLIALGTNAAYFYSVYSVLRATTSKDFKGTDFFETSSMLISFILLGKYLEVLAKGKTSEAIAKLMDLAPETAILLTLDAEGNVVTDEEIDSRLIQKNDVIKIIPGAKVASDGFVIWGQSHVNESMITGEARPVAKRKGDTVIGGTLNENGVLHIKATRVGSESALSQIVRLVESAQLAKAPVQKFADRISKYFVPLVIILSFSTWLAWFLSGKFHGYPESWIPSSMDSFELALQFGISVMVIACPCALGLATPTAQWIAQINDSDFIKIHLDGDRERDLIVQTWNYKADRPLNYYLVKKYKKLPSVPTVGDPGLRSNFAFGYDSINDDYKVLRISVEVHVYSLKAHSWRRVESESPYRESRISLGPVSLNGALIWLVESANRGIRLLSFHLATEIFYIQTLTLPVEPQNLEVLGGSLCVSAYRREAQATDFWMMKETSWKETRWSLLFTVPLTTFQRVVFSPDGQKVLMEMNYEKNPFSADMMDMDYEKNLFWYDIKKKAGSFTLKHIRNKIWTGTCEESLLLLDGDSIY
ncbi:probable copper-transporting ATPase HMA5 [Corylus avellana]|uniref:probable copper-transporting ATPase HMA5 n=1 Tax=Corylus avellana TaxID=13451 RepID=UPI00286CE171|nr:probable copper-transporting ATPase HMA5 [Corylus avellana]